jgi:catechol 2,3-dioxygenase
MTSVLPGRPVARSGANIVRAAHGEYRVTDLGRARAFYVDALGFIETERTENALYLRGFEERDHHSLVLRRAGSPGAGHLCFRVGDGDDLDRLERFFIAEGLTPRWVETVERLLQRFDLYRGARIQRFDHFNCQTPDVDAAYSWWARGMGFGCSEYTVGDDNGDVPGRLWAVWLQRKGNVHDLAIMNGIGPRVHHFGYWVAEPTAILAACDVLAGAGLVGAIERGPGRHGISNAFFLYLRDPDGNRIELFANDYLVVDPDWEPLRWSLEDPRRATFWGHVAPPCWFDEAALCESVLSGELLPTTASTMRDRPQHVT